MNTYTKDNYSDTYKYLCKNFPDYPCRECKKVEDNTDCNRGPGDCPEFRLWFSNSWSRIHKCGCRIADARDAKKK